MGRDRLTILSDKPPSPRTTFSEPWAAIFSGASSSRSRIKAGLFSRILTVLAWRRMAAVSYRRVVRPASAFLRASIAGQNHVADAQAHNLHSEGGRPPALAAVGRLPGQKGFAAFVLGAGFEPATTVTASRRSAHRANQGGHGRRLRRNPCPERAP